uniref:PE-PGRS family protein n=1 Tax=Parastrongyloides trichosuri TaxID=131310 RepID=A0A0N4ZLB6_PARTI
MKAGSGRASRGQGAVQIGAAVAEEAPGRAVAIQEVQVEGVHQHALLPIQALDQIAAMIGDEGVAVVGLACIRHLLVADAVGADDRHDVGHGVTLHGAPPRGGGVQGGVMRLAADGGGVEQNLRAQQRHAAGALGEPLVPADADADAAEAGVPDLEAGVAGAEVVLLLIAGAVRNMALAIDAHQLAVCVDHHQAVEIVRSLALEDGDGQYDAQLPGHRLKLGHGRMLAPRIGGAEPLLFLRDAEVRPLEQLRRQDDLSALGRRLTDESDGLVDVRLHVLAVGGLDGGEMEGTAARQGGDRRQGDDLAIGEDSGQGLAGQTGGHLIAIGRHDDSAVRDQEVHMAGRNRALVLVQDQARRRDAQHPDRATGGVGHGRERLGGFVIDFGVGVLGAETDRAGDDAGRDEAGQVVDVAVGMVVQQAVAQPQHLPGAQGLGEGGFGRFFGPAGVAVAVQHALARGQHRALAVMIHGAAFQNEVMAGQGDARLFADLVGDLIIVRQVVLAAPAVEDEGLGRRRSGAEDRPRVAQPDVAETSGHDSDAGHASEARLSVGQGLVIADHQLDLFAARPGQGAHQGLDLGLGRFEVVFPQIGMAGPADPHRAMRRPLSGDRQGHGRSHGPKTST